MPNQPRTAYDKDYFHQIYWMKFAKRCDPPWLMMTPLQKKERLRAFIFEKFTLDPWGRCMLPGPGEKRKKRNDAFWPDFWLSDTELDIIVTQVMIAYEAPRPLHEVARAFVSGGGTTTTAPF